MLAPYMTGEGNGYYDQEAIDAPVAIGVSGIVMIAVACSIVLLTAYVIAILVGGV